MVLNFLFLFFSLERFSSVASGNGCGQKCCGDFPTITFLGGCCSLLSELRVVC